MATRGVRVVEASMLRDELAVVVRVRVLREERCELVESRFVELKRIRF